MGQLDVIVAAKAVAPVFGTLVHQPRYILLIWGILNDYWKLDTAGTPGWARQCGKKKIFVIMLHYQDARRS